MQAGFCEPLFTQGQRSLIRGSHEKRQTAQRKELEGRRDRIQDQCGLDGVIANGLTRFRFHGVCSSWICPISLPRPPCSPNWMSHGQLHRDPVVAHRAVGPHEDRELRLAGVALFQTGQPGHRRGSPRWRKLSRRILMASFSPRSRLAPSARLVSPRRRTDGLSSIFSSLSLSCPCRIPPSPPAWSPPLTNTVAV